MAQIIKKILPILLILKIMISGFGWCGHSHNEAKFLNSDHTFLHVIQQQHEDKDENCDHHETHSKCRCDCMGHTVAIHDCLLTSFDLYFTARTITSQSNYTFEWIPFVYYPPLS